MSTRRSARTDAAAAPRPPFRLYELPICMAMILLAAAGTLVVQRLPGTTPDSLVTAPEPQPSPPLEVISEPRFLASPIPPDAPAVSAPRAPGARTRGLPRRGPQAIRAQVQIPSLAVTAPVVAVGLDANGEMVTPRNARDVAWLDNGTFPGSTRNALLAAHRNFDGRAGAFSRLEKLPLGEIVRVWMDDRLYTFAVRWVRTYDPESAPLDELMGPTSVDSLTLVTCAGEFDRRTGHYPKRVVARAELVGVS